MSRGLGACQRFLLEAFDAHAEGAGLVVTSAAESRSDAVSLRRAAHTLAARGLVRLVSVVDQGSRRVVIYQMKEQKHD